MYQLQLCLGKESPPTILPHFVKAKFIERSTEGSSRSINIFARLLRIEVAKQEILRKLGMKKRPPKMNNLMSTIPKPVFDGEIGSMYSKSEDEEPTKTTQVVIPAEQGLFYTIILSLRYVVDLPKYSDMPRHFSLGGGGDLPIDQLFLLKTRPRKILWPTLLQYD